MRLEAVRFSFEGASLVIAGQGMPSQTLGSGRTGPFWLVGRQSPKLEGDSYQSRYNRRGIENSFHLRIVAYLVLVRGLLLAWDRGDWSCFDSSVERLEEGVCIFFGLGVLSQASHSSSSTTRRLES